MRNRITHQPYNFRWLNSLPPFSGPRGRGQSNDLALALPWSTSWEAARRWAGREFGKFYLNTNVEAYSLSLHAIAPIAISASVWRLAWPRLASVRLNISPKRTPVILVPILFNGPRYSSGAYGFGSKDSCWVTPPGRKIKMTLLAVPSLLM